jgi:hypothetical protein
MANRPTETDERERFSELFENGGPLERQRGNLRNVGGTSGGIGSFFLGVGLLALSLYLIATNTIVSTGFWSFYGYSAFGPILLALMVGIGFLFFNAKSIVGWLLSVGGVVAILLNIILNLRVSFQSTTLLSAIFMFGTLAAGLGLIGRSLRSSKG